MILKEEVSREQLPLLIKQIKKCLKTPCIVLLTGEMGSGKTTFVQFFMENSELPTSPTYSLINKMGDIAHADFYRIKSKEELDYLEISLYNECQYIFIEWGKPFLHSIFRELGSQFLYYELKIHEKSRKTATREYILSQY